MRPIIEEECKMKQIDLSMTMAGGLPVDTPILTSHIKCTKSSDKMAINSNCRKESVDNGKK